MCVVVELAPSPCPKPEWRRGDAAIRVPSHLGRPQMLTLARTVLQELGAEQPAESTMEARCYCGDPLTIQDMPDVLPAVPEQRVYGVAEAHHGA